MKCFALKWSVVAVALVSTFALVQAASAAENPAGKWTWTANFGGKGGKAGGDVTLNLKLEGDKLTGAITMGTMDTPIEDGSFKDDTVTFSVTRERNGNKSVTKYSGKVSGDTIKGKIDSDRAGKTNSRDWEAKRAAP